MENVGSILHRKQTMRAVIHYIVQDQWAQAGVCFMS